MTFRNMPIRRKVMTMILFVSGTVSVLTCATLFTYDYVTFRQTTRQSLVVLGQIIANNSTAAMAFQNQDDAEEILTALKAEHHIDSAALYDGSGRLFAKYPADLPGADFPAQPGPEGYRFASSRLSGFQTVAVDGRPLGTLYLESNLAAMGERLRVYGRVLALLVVVSFLLAFTLSAWLQRGVSRPIHVLTETAEIVSRGDYSIRATKLGGGELGPGPMPSTTCWTKSRN